MFGELRDRISEMKQKYGSDEALVRLLSDLGTVVDRLEKATRPKDAHEWAVALCALFNTFDGSSAYRKKAQEFLYEHRTVQQSFTRFMVQFIDAKAAENCCDGRDQASHDLCLKLSACMTAEDRYLPMI